MPDNKKFSDFLKISWIKSSIKLGIIFLVIGFTVLFLLKILNIGGTQFFFDAKVFVAEYGLAGIFLATILAGTVVPLGSPALVVAAVMLGTPLVPLILVATAGFTVGMLINYGLAYRLGRPYVMRKVSEEKFEEINGLWSRWGWIIYAIFGFIPFLPVELLSLLCGLLKARLDIFLALSVIPRLAVFTLLAYFGEHIGFWIGLT